jgi:glutamyl-tRNA reductase
MGHPSESHSGSQRLVAVGMSHRTASIELRERLAVGDERIPALLSRLHAEGLTKESVLLSTCNRVELYCVPGANEAPGVLTRWLAEMGGLKPRSAEPHMYRFEAQDALLHLYRVTSSLDSMVVGEPQILGQVKRAYRLAQESQTAGSLMHRVMDSALNVAKRVHTETDIGREAVSVGRAGVKLAGQVLGSLEGKTALLIGAGAHGKIVARALLDFGLSELVVANRTFERAVELAQRFDASAVHLSEIERYFPRVDIVLCSTAAGKTLISKESIARTARKRRYRSLVMIDLSVPRNIDPAVNDLSGVFRFDVDDLVQVADQGKEKRHRAAEAAEELVRAAAERAWRQLMGATVGGRIGDVVRRAEDIRHGELMRAGARLESLAPEQRAAVDAMTRAIVKKVLHDPLRHVRRLAEAGDFKSTEVIFDAFCGPDGGDDND